MYLYASDPIGKLIILIDAMRTIQMGAELVGMHLPWHR